MISSPIDEIKSRLNIVDVIQDYIKLQKAGANYRAVCPFHSEKTPSFFVSPARQIWHCFGSCGEGGDIFKFVMKIEGVEFGDALRILAQKAGVELKKQDPKLQTERQRLYAICEIACRFYQKQLGQGESGKEAKEYLQNRGITQDSIDKWRIGYAPDMWHSLSDFLISNGYKREEIEKAGLLLNSEKSGGYYDRFRGRIIIPVFDLSSQVIGFGGRIFKKGITKATAGGSKGINKPEQSDIQEAKYINSPATILYDKSRVLYGLNKAGLAIRKKDFFVVVEGYMDAIMAHQGGYENVVAASGTALTQFHLNILRRYSENFYAAFDMDTAGDSATKRGIELAQALGFNIKVVIMKQGYDPADIILSNPNDWEVSVSNAKSIHDFYFESALSKFDKNTPDGRKAISKMLLPIIKKIPNRIEQDVWIQDLAKTINIREENILEELRKTKIETTEIILNKEEPKKAPDQKKGRKELLEENILILSAKNPKNLEKITNDEIDLFSPAASFAANYFKNNGFEVKEVENNDYKNWMNFLLVRAESEFQHLKSEREMTEEFCSCLKEFKKIIIKAKLDTISAEIKLAENNNDIQKLQELTHEFNHKSKSLYDLESA